MTCRHAGPYREVTPFEEDWIEDYKSDAYEFHDTLVRMGGRATRPVLEEPAGKAIYEKDKFLIVDEKGELQCTVVPDANLTLHHWKSEHTRFEEELDRWRDFRNYQESMEHKPLLKTPFDQSNTDQRLIQILVRLNDWREFQYYYQRVKVGRALMSTWKTTRQMEKIMREEAASNQSSPYPEAQRQLNTCFKQLFPRQSDLEAAQTQLTWIESQVPEMLVEACASLEADFPLQQQLELKLERQANAFNQELKMLEAKPVPSLQSPRQSADIAERICHWGSEITRLMQEHEQWKIFLLWRKRQPSTEETANIVERGSSEQLSDLRIWRDYVYYRRYQLDRTRSWVAGWQRYHQSSENDMKTIAKDQWLFILENTVSNIRAYVEKFQQDINNIELQVRWAEQQLVELSSQRSSPAMIQMSQQSNTHPQLPLSSPNSEPIQNIPDISSLVHLSSSPVEVHRIERSTKSPVSGIPHFAQPSNVPKERRNIAAKEAKIPKKQPVNVPNQVKANADTQMMEAPDHAGLGEATGDGERVEVIHTPKSDVGEVVMMDAEEPIDTCSRIASEVPSKCRSTRISRKSSLPICQAPTSKKTRSAKKLDQTISGRVLKPAVKKPVRKAKAFTDRQNMALLSPTLVEGSPTISPPRRKSQRLRDKAAAPSLTSLSRVEVNEPSKSSRQKKPRKPVKSVGPSHSQRKEKQKLQPRALETQQKSKQRKSKMPTKATKPSSSSRRKRLKSQ